MGGGGGGMLEVFEGYGMVSVGDVGVNVLSGEFMIVGVEVVVGEMKVGEVIMVG